jgi:DtxR family Mn-dependent transcriptional regulator
MTVAIEMLRHHRLIETFLAELLGVPWHQVHEEAERLEHVLSEDLEDRIAAKLGNPNFDPHGDPIPSRDGLMPTRTLIHLTGLSPKPRAPSPASSSRRSRSSSTSPRLG